MPIFNLFIIPLREIRFTAFVTDNNNQLALKCIKKACHTVFGLHMAGRLVDNAFYVKLTENQVRISLKPTFMYFQRFFILPPPPPPPLHPALLLKSSQKITFDGEMVIFFTIKQPNTSVYLFVIDFTILDRLRTSTRFILYDFCHIFIHTYEIKRNFGEKEILLSYYLPWCLTSIWQKCDHFQLLRTVNSYSP